MDDSPDEYKVIPETSDFRRELECAINRFSKENGSNTPDFILAEYLDDCLKAFDKTSRAREKWFRKELSIDNLGPQEIKPQGDL